jgi:membrane protease YdiL (CAAX protease family)
VLLLMLIITAASHGVPKWIAPMFWPMAPDFMIDWGFRNFYLLFALGFGIVLVAGALRRSGVQWGRTHQCLLRCALVSIVPIVAAAIIYPLLPAQPWRGGPIGTWLISPLAQDLVFIGYIYGRLGVVFPGVVHKRFPVDKALLIAGAFFSAWHLPNFLSLDPGFVVFQLVYTYVLFVWTGLTRQWTGSILFFTLTHSAINFIATIL